MATKEQYTFQVGDRVAERPKTHCLLAVRQETKERIAQHRTQRYGTVISLHYKRNAKGVRQKFLMIQWDHLQSPCEHAQMRICHIDRFEELMVETCNAT